MKSMSTISLITLELMIICTMVGCSRHHGMISAEDSNQKFYGSPSNNTPQAHINTDAVFMENIECFQANTLQQHQHSFVNKTLNMPTYNYPANQTQAMFSQELTLSSGDMIEVTIEDGDGFSGNYVINPNGTIQFPMIKPVGLVGLSVQEVEEKISLALIRNEIFQPATTHVIVRVLEWAAIEVLVSGAVFEPGRVLINNKVPQQVHENRQLAFGDYSPTRFLTEALRAASGIRPDAKIDQVILIRNGWQFEIDLSGVFDGTPVQDIALVANDQIIVPTSNCFQPRLVRPSQITPKGFRVFMSNLTTPAFDNASSAVGRYSTSLPYGTRLLQAAVSSNCMGGARWTNANREVVLASKNPLTGETQVISRSLETLIKNPHRNELNPYLMPNDALACYDSDVSNFRDIARTVTDILTPFKLF